MKFARYKHDSDYSYAEGATLVYELINTRPDSIRQIFLRPVEKYGNDIEKILKSAQNKNIPIVASTKPFNVLGAKNACLLIAEFQKNRQEINPNHNHLLLVNPSDAGNLGTITRTALAFNIRDIAIIPPAVDHFDPKTVRASMGALFHLNIQIYPNFKSYRKSNQNHNCYAFMLNDTAETILGASAHKSEPWTIVMGNEAAGLPSEYGELCSPVYIPQSKDVDSLNLSIATALALYEFTQK